MKFLHTSDIHIGAKFEVLGDKAREHREQLKKTFSKIVALAIEEKVDLFLISGDLFDSNNPSPSDIKFVQEEFSRLISEKIRICLIPGNHDYELSNIEGLGKKFYNMEGVYLFINPIESNQYFEDIHTEIFAKANVTNKSSKSPMVKVFSEKTAIKIVMAHGGVVGQAKNPQWPITPKEIENSGADYVALGDWHSLRDESRAGVTAYYSGAPEMINITQGGAGYVILGIITYSTNSLEQENFTTKDDSFAPIRTRTDRAAQGASADSSLFSSGQAVRGKKELHLESKKVGVRYAKELNINLGEIKNVSELKNKIIELSDANLVLIVKISGINTNKINVNANELEEELLYKFWRLKITDKARLPIDDFNEEDYPSILVSGQFVYMLKEKIKNTKNDEDRKLYEEALQLGLAAFQDPDVIQ